MACPKSQGFGWSLAFRVLCRCVVTGRTTPAARQEGVAKSIPLPDRGLARCG